MRDGVDKRGGVDKIFSEEVMTAALGGNFSPLRSIPKAELHAHALLSAPFGVYHALSEGRANPPPLQFSGYQQFEAYLRSELVPVLHTPHGTQAVFAAALDQMVFDGVVYAEISVDCMTQATSDTAWDDVAHMITQEIRRVANAITVKLDLGIAREMDGRDWLPRVDAAIKTGIFSGVDLYGDERVSDAGKFLQFFERARDHNLRIKLHCGEQQSAAEMLHELNLVKPDAVQHGIGGAGDAAVIEYVKAGNIPVNICPTSNVKLGLVRNYADHPIRSLFDAGVQVTVNTDDYALFGSSLSEEFLHFYRCGAFNAAELEVIRLNGLERSAN